MAGCLDNMKLRGHCNSICYKQVEGILISERQCEVCIIKFLGTNSGANQSDSFREIQTFLSVSGKVFKRK